MFPESQRHVIECFVLRQKIKDKIKLDGVKYEYIDGSVSEQEQFAKVCTKLLNLRPELLSKNEDDSSQEEGQSTEDQEDTAHQIF